MSPAGFLFKASRHCLSGTRTLSSLQNKRFYPDTLIPRSGHRRGLSEIKADMYKATIWNPNALSSLHKRGFQSALKSIIYSPLGCGNHNGR